MVRTYAIGLLVLGAAIGSCAEKSSDCVDTRDCPVDVDAGSDGSNAPRPLTFSTDPVVVAPGEVATVIVRLREPAASGIALAVRDLPRGVTTVGATVAAGSSSAALVLRAAADAVQQSQVATVDTGTPNFGSAPVTVIVRGPICSIDATHGKQGTISVATPGGSAPFIGAVFDADKIIALANDASKASVVRLNADLTPDASFQSGARVRVDFGTDQQERLLAAALQSDRKIVVVGHSVAGGTSDRNLVARLKPDGSLDSNFGTGGKLVNLYPGVLAGQAGSRARAVVQVPDGKLLVAGEATSGTGTVAVMRLGANGDLDGTFGSSGGALASDADHSGAVSRLALTPGGSILGIGNFVDRVGSDSVSRWGITRFTGSGSLDTTYATKGFFKLAVGDNDRDKSAGAQAFTKDATDRIVAASGGISSGQAIFAAARITVEGRLDSSFNSGALVTVPLGNGSARVISVLETNGKLVLVGSSPLGELTIARLTADGKVDPTCGSQGKFGTNFGLTSAIPSIARIDDLGRLVVVGTASSGTWIGRVWL